MGKGAQRRDKHIWLAYWMDSDGKAKGKAAQIVRGKRRAEAKRETRKEFDYELSLQKAKDDHAWEMYHEVQRALACTDDWPCEWCRALKEDVEIER